MGWLREFSINKPYTAWELYQHKKLYLKYRIGLAVVKLLFFISVVGLIELSELWVRICCGVIALGLLAITGKIAKVVRDNYADFSYYLNPKKVSRYFNKPLLLETFYHQHPLIRNYMNQVRNIHLREVTIFECHKLIDFCATCGVLDYPNVIFLPNHKSAPIQPHTDARVADDVGASCEES